MSTNKITITPATDKPEAWLLGKPKKALYSVPQWYKDQSSKVPEDEMYEGSNSMFTVKRCMPFFDAFSQDFIISTQYDFAITKDIKQNFQFQIFTDKWKPGDYVFGKDLDYNDIGLHGNAQFSNAPIPNEYYSKTALKWNNPYVINTPQKHSLMFYHPHNRFDLPFYTFSGIVDSGEFPLPVNFPFLLKNDFVGIIPKGTPVVQFSVVQKNNWSIKENDFKMESFEENIKKFYSRDSGAYRDLYRYLKRDNPRR